jgi:hypothetical protein
MPQSALGFCEVRDIVDPGYIRSMTMQLGRLSWITQRVKLLKEKEGRATTALLYNNGGQE